MMDNNMENEMDDSISWWLIGIRVTRTRAPFFAKVSGSGFRVNVRAGHVCLIILNPTGRWRVLIRSLRT